MSYANILKRGPWDHSRIGRRKHPNPLRRGDPPCRAWLKLEINRHHQRFKASARFHLYSRRALRDGNPWHDPRRSHWYRRWNCRRNIARDRALYRALPF